jgi:hypothetical protein
MRCFVELPKSDYSRHLENISKKEQGVKPAPKEKKSRAKALL